MSGDVDVANLGFVVGITAPMDLRLDFPDFLQRLNFGAQTGLE